MSLQLAEQYEANEQYAEALEEYKKEYSTNPDDTDLLERLGHVALILEKKDEAAGYYIEMLKKDVTNTLAYEQLMTIYEDSDKYKYYIYRGNKNSIERKLEFALNDFKKALNYAQDNEAQVVMTRLTIANLYIQLGKKEKALDEFNVIMEHDNLNEDIYLQLVNLYMQDNIYSSAIDTLKRAKEKGIDTIRINEALALVYLKSGNPQATIETTKNELIKIKAMLELGQTNEVKEILENIPQEYKELPDYYTTKAQYYYTIKDFDKALQGVEEYNRMQPNSPLTFQMRALICEETGDEYNAHLNWGRYNMVRGDKDVAINELLNAVQLKATDVDLLFTLASLLTENGDTNHAAEYYEKIVRIEPQNSEALKKLAEFRESIGDYRKQLEYLERLAQNREPEAIKLLAKAYEKNREKNKAIEAYRKYMELTNNPSEIKLIQDKIAKLENQATSDDADSVGLIDKIMGFFSKDKM